MNEKVVVTKYDILNELVRDARGSQSEASKLQCLIAIIETAMQLVKEITQ